MRKLIIFLALLICETPIMAQWTVTGTNIYNSNTGNVGIGTTAPNAKLQVIGNAIIGQNIAGANATKVDITSGASNQDARIDFGYYTTFDATAYVIGRWGADASFRISDYPTGTELTRFFISSAGNIGVGTITPAAKVDIVGAGGSSIDFQTTGRVKIKSAVSPGIWLNDNATDKTFFGYAPGFANHAAGIYTSGSGQWNSFNVFQDGSVSIGSAINNTNAKLDVTGNIYCNSKMYIGIADANTTSRIANYSLAVNGTAIFNKAKVLLYGTPWPDYVFEEKYGLQPLEALESFIKSNKHLPNVPTAAEVEKDGLDLGNNQTLLLQKIEELTLYTIDQNKKNAQQQEQIDQLLQEVKSLKAQSKKAN